MSKLIKRLSLIALANAGEIAQWGKETAETDTCVTGSFKCSLATCTDDANNGVYCVPDAFDGKTAMYTITETDSASLNGFGCDVGAQACKKVIVDDVQDEETVEDEQEQVSTPSAGSSILIIIVLILIGCLSMAGYCLWSMVKRTEDSRQRILKKELRKREKLRDRLREQRKKDGFKFASMSEFEEVNMPHGQLPSDLNKWNDEQKFRHSNIDFIDERDTGDEESGNPKPKANKVKQIQTKIQYDSSMSSSSSMVSKPNDPSSKKSQSKVEKISIVEIEEEYNFGGNAKAQNDIELASVKSKSKKEQAATAGIRSQVSQLSVQKENVPEQYASAGIRSKVSLKSIQKIDQPIEYKQDSESNYKSAINDNVQKSAKGEEKDEEKPVKTEDVEVEITQPDTDRPLVEKNELDI